MHHRISIATAVLLGAAAFTSTQSAQAAEFIIVAGPLQLIEFDSEAPVEDIHGMTNQASGKVSLDLANPNQATGRVEVAVDSLRTGNTKRDSDLHGEHWLDAANHPKLIFALESVKLDHQGALAPGAKVTGTIRGKLTLKGNTRAIEAKIKLAYLESNEKLKKAYIPGDALRIKGSFDVKLADFGINPPTHLLGVKIAETVQVSFGLTGLEKK